jgi:CelD/BcsL family acetyltransferase involved in cellulose biosynthesis
MAMRRSIDAIDRATWDGLAARSAWATPFSSWAYHRAWWDAYGGSAHDETIVVVDPVRPGAPVAIVPLMHRHAIEPGDEATRSTIRHGHDLRLTPVAPRARSVYFGASYHSDYATVLSAPEDLPDVAGCVVDLLSTPASDARQGPQWDVVDLRRLRCGDPAVDALEAAFTDRARVTGWSVDVEREDVCPVVTLPAGADFDSYLGTLHKKSRHEIRRKVRRAESVGEVRLQDSPDALADLDAFIDLHQKRWGELGLFPPTPGGDASRRFARRLFELFGSDGPLRLAFLTVGGRRIAAGIHFETADGYLYYNAGIDPDGRDLSPGVVMIERYVRRAMVAGKRRLDFLRGDEPYKYEWGAVDEPIQRILVRCPGQ